MKIEDAIAKIDSLKPNTYTTEEKIAWLSNCEWLVKHKIIDTHKYNTGETEISFNGYDENTALSTTLIAPEPYSDLYVYWLMWNIDFNNGEPDKYNNSVAMYESTYSEFRNYYNRTHMPIGANVTYATF